MDHREYLMALKEYIEENECQMDAEYGSCRTLERLIADGYMPEVYDETLHRIAVLDETERRIEAFRRSDGGVENLVALLHDKRN